MWKITPPLLPNCRDTPTPRTPINKLNNRHPQRNSKLLHVDRLSVARAVCMSRPDTEIISREKDLPAAEKSGALDVIARHERDGLLAHRRGLLPCHCAGDGANLLKAVGV